jgi:hypothetical protein
MRCRGSRDTTLMNARPISIAAAAAASGETEPSHSIPVRISRPIANAASGPCAIATRRTSARCSARDRTPPPSTMKPNLDGNAQRDLSDASRPSSSRPVPLASSTSAGSIPARGLIITLRTASPSALSSRSPRLAIASCNDGNEPSRIPRICRLARRVRSMWPLPKRRAPSASTRNSCGLNLPDRGRMRTTSPSPLCIGRKAPGHQPFTSYATERFTPRGPFA